MGKKENHDAIYRFMHQGMVEKDSLLIQNNRLLSTEKQFTESISKETAQKIPWLLAYSGYSMEKIQELQEQHNINLIEINTRVLNPIVNAVCTNPLIVLARVDTIYTDKSIEDGFRTSIVLTIKETVKGDTSIKKAIIRTNTAEMVIQGGQRTFQQSGHIFLPFKEHQEYIICLNKSWYEWERLRIGNSNAERDYSTYYSTASTTCVSLTPKEDPEKEKIRLEKIQQIRDLCKQLAGFFRSLKK
jgi:hypothetical protein